MFEGSSNMFLTKCVDLEVFVGLSRAALGLPHQNRMGDPDFIMSKQVTDRSRELLDWAVEKTKKDDEKKQLYGKSHIFLKMLFFHVLCSFLVPPLSPF